MKNTLAPQRFVCSAVAAAVLLVMSGCKTPRPLQSGQSTTPATAAAPAVPLSAAEQQMRQDSDRFNKTVIARADRCAVGAGVGVLAALLTGGNKKEIRNSAVAVRWSARGRRHRRLRDGQEGAVRPQRDPRCRRLPPTCARTTRSCRPSSTAPAWCSAKAGSGWRR